MTGGPTTANLRRQRQPRAAKLVRRQDEMTWTTAAEWWSSKIWRQAMESDPSQIRMILTAVLATLSLAASAALAEEQPSIPPVQLVRETVQNEINSNNDQAKFMFRDRKITP